MGIYHLRPASGSKERVVSGCNSTCDVFVADWKEGDGWRCWNDALLELSLLEHSFEVDVLCFREPSLYLRINKAFLEGRC